MCAESSDPQPKIISDESWKEQARREKERLAEEERGAPPAAAAAGAAPKEARPVGGVKKGPAPGRGDRRGPLPQVTFLALVNSLAMQALFNLGGFADPKGNPVEPDLDVAKYHIDILQVLEEKTKGNLTEEEHQALTGVLHEVRMQFVQASQM